MNQLTITKATVKDIDGIEALQNQHLLSKCNNPADGFLVSGFTAEDYRKFIGEYEYFYIAKIENKICGVLMAYHSSKISNSDNSNMLIKNSLKTDFILIKQIFTSKTYASKGIASKLYSKLFAENALDLPYVTVIVSEPVNVASCNFHKKMEFENFLDFEPNADKDGQIRDRSVWIKIPEHCELAQYVRFTNKKQIEDFGETIMSRSSELTSLYTHEDNLNWTKMNMQITLIFALFAAFIYFYEKNLIPDSLPVVFILSFWGLSINLVFYLKIKSGIKYMMTHKESIKSFDAKIKLFFPILTPIFPRGNRISKKSVTVKILPALSLLGLISWLTVSILLILKGLDIYSINF